MRRNNQIGIAGPALLALGLAMLALGFFGGQLGIPGLTVVNTYWGPENATLCVYPVASWNEPNWVVAHYWYGYSDTEPGVYHSIDGSEVKVYIDGQYYTTLVTNRDQTKFYTPLYKLSVGTHEIRFVYEGTPGKPYPPCEVTEYVTISSSGSSSVDPNPTPVPQVDDALKLIGAGLSLIGAALCYRGRR